MKKQTKKSSKSAVAVPAVTSKTRILSTAQVTPKSKYSLNVSPNTTKKAYSIPLSPEQRSLSAAIAAHHAHAYMNLALWKFMRATAVIAQVRSSKSIDKAQAASVLAKYEPVIKAQSVEAKKQRANLAQTLKSVESDFQRRLTANQLTSPAAKTIAASITAKFNKEFAARVAA